MKPNKTMDPRFEVRQATGMGWGLFVREDISQGDRIVEYTGVKIPTKVADLTGSKYLFAIDEEWTIDGVAQENHGRWINHACVPNIEARDDDGRIVFYALRDIFEGEELTLNYGEEYFDELIKPHGCMCGAVKHLK